MLKKVIVLSLLLATLSIFITSCENFDMQNSDGYEQSTIYDVLDSDLTIYYNADDDNTYSSEEYYSSGIDLQVAWEKYRFARNEWLLMQESDDAVIFKRFVEHGVLQLFSVEGYTAFLGFAQNFLDLHCKPFTWSDILDDWYIDLIAERDSEFVYNEIIDFEVLRIWLQGLSVNFSWIEHITPEQLAIVVNYIEMPAELFQDHIIIDYILEVVLVDMFPTPELSYGVHLLRYYDKIPFDQYTDNPIRILTRIYEIYLLQAIEHRIATEPGLLNRTSESTLRFSREFNRELRPFG